MPALRAALPTVAAVLLLAACAQAPGSFRSAGPPRDMAGTWLVDGVYDSGTRLPTPQERVALENQAMRVSDGGIIDPLGRTCDSPTYEIRGTSAADWFGFGNAWLARRGPEVPLTAVTVYCDGAAFDGYAIRDDGTLVGRYKDAFVVMRRADDPRVADRLAAVGDLDPPQAASAGPVVIGAPEPAPETMAPASAGLLIAVPEPEPAPEPVAEEPAAAAVLHLASLRTRAAAESEWAAIRDRVPLLRDWAVSYRAVSLPEKGDYVRVFAAPPAGVTPAAACALLEGAGQYCRVMS